MSKLTVTAMALLVLLTSPVWADQRYSLRVDGLTCPFCAATSEKALRGISGVRSVTTNLKAGVISVCARPGVRFTDAQLSALFLSKGFTYRGMSRQGRC